VTLEESVRALYREFGPPKPMGSSAPALDRPHFFLHRNFLGEQDLAILFNTKRCQYNCRFCALPRKSSKEWIGPEWVNAQFHHVVHELKHSIGVMDRLTIANEGSVFDETTFPAESLMEIVRASRALPRIRKLVIESRLEFVTVDRLRQVQAESGKRLDVLTGFETHDPALRDRILGKKEPLDGFLAGLDRLAEAGCELTTYVLFKPSPLMTDDEAREEAERSMDYVSREAASRGIPLIIRLNPMYVARGTPWARLAEKTPDYQPPRLTDVLELAARKKAEGMRVYVGLTSEGLADDPGTYRSRDDFSSKLIKIGIIYNSPEPAAA
jgi:archaeosine synthase beta-subunit